MLYRIALLFAFALSCTTLGRQPEAITERSAEARPAWTRFDTETELKSKSANVGLIYVREDIYRIDLGLKQAQLVAVDKTHTLLVERVRQILLSLVPQGQGEVDRALAQATQSIRNKKHDAVVRDVYWEKVEQRQGSGPAKQFYRVFVLLTLAREDHDELLHAAAKALSHSKDAKARDVAKSVLRDLESKVSKEGT